MVRWLGLTLAVVMLLGSMSASAADKPRQKVQLAVSTTVINIGYPMLTLPLTLGYWRDEGYDVELEPVGASLQSIQQLVAGNADLAEVNASVIVQANAKNDLPVRIAMDNGVIDWSVAVDADGPIKSIRDLKGKTIGVFSLATGGIAYFNNYLMANGLDPARDVDIVPLGLGAPPVEALRTGRVQGLLYWGSAIAAFENTGLKLRKLAGEDWRQYPDFSLAVMQQTAAKNPDMVVAIARGIAKATVYALANPDCARKLHWQHFPATKATGADDATLARWDLNIQQAQLDAMTEAFALNGGKLWGNADPAAYDRLVHFMMDTKQIDTPVSGKSMLVDIPNFFQRVNDFDVKAVQASAAACQQ